MTPRNASVSNGPAKKSSAAPLFKNPVYVLAYTVSKGLSGSDELRIYV